MSVHLRDSAKTCAIAPPPFPLPVLRAREWRRVSPSLSREVLLPFASKCLPLPGKPFSLDLLDLPLTKSLRGESFTSHCPCGQQTFITLVRFR